MVGKTAFLFDNPDFQPSELEVCNVSKDRAESGLEDIEDKLFKTAFPIVRHAVVKRLQRAGLPKPGEQLQFVTMRQFSAIELLDLILETAQIDEMALVVYSISRVNAARLKRMVLSGSIRRLEILVSSLRNTAAREKEDATFKILEGTPRLEFFFASSHAKILATKTTAGDCFCLSGSGNLASNSRIEQYCLDNSRSLYDFHRAWIAEVRAHGVAATAKG